MPQVQPMPVSQPTQTGMQTLQQPNIPSATEDKSGLVKTIVIIVVSLIAVTFAGLFVWMFLQYNAVSTDVQAQIDEAVAIAKSEQAVKLEAEFLEREKHPYRTFSGPVDYGQLTFEYPGTWSVYVAADASNGGDYEAYFNPVQVEAISRSSINALNLFIQDRSFEDVISAYQRYIDNSSLKVETITVNGYSANRYVGNIPGTDFNGAIVIIKIRDKTAILQTDSVLFMEDFNRLISTITFNA